MAEFPLAGRTVVVTRPESGASELAGMLGALGAHVRVVPLIEIEPLECGAALRAALARLTADDWLVVTSANAVVALTRVKVFPRARVAAVGEATASHLPRVDLVPERKSAAGLVEEMPAGTGRVVVLQAQGGAPTLVDGLAAKGWHVERIDTHVARPIVPPVADQLALLRADAVVFTSGSQARAWGNVLGSAAPPVVVAIGPQTAADACAAGLLVTDVAEEHTLPGVVAALERALAR